MDPLAVLRNNSVMIAAINGTPEVFDLQKQAEMECVAKIISAIADHMMEAREDNKHNPVKIYLNRNDNADHEYARKIITEYNDKTLSMVKSRLRERGICVKVKKRM